MKKFKEWINDSQVWGFVVGVAVMAIIALAFFYPDNFEGNSLQQPDIKQGIAIGQEPGKYEMAPGEQPLWTDALFGGMPTFQISPSYPSNRMFNWMKRVYELWLPTPSGLLFSMMFGFFILMFAMRFRWYYSLIGAVAWGFSSYFIIIIGAGHIWKFMALTYVPPTIAGLILAYRGRYVVGGAMTALFAMLQISSNHPQMTYYFGFLIVALIVCWLIEAVRERKLSRWAIATAVSLFAGILAVGANLPSLYNTYEYSKETKRSQSELTPLTVAAETGVQERPTGGLPKSDILGWCYGRSETFSLLIPNIKGGASARPEKGNMVHLGLDRLPEAKEFANKPAASLLPYMSQYFNDSEGTNGPVYVGAIICALFLIGCFIVKGPIKWALVFTTILTVLLAWGKNFEWLTDFFIYNVPLYSKFRAVESILVVAEFTMPLLAMMALWELLRDRDSFRRHKAVVVSVFSVCGFISLLAAVAPGVFGDFITSTDRAYASQIAQQVTEMAERQGYTPAQIQQVVYQYSLSNPENLNAIKSLRYGMVSADAWRTFVYLALSALLLWLFSSRKIGSGVTVAGIGVLVLFDLYGVDKRYLDHDSFVAVNPVAPAFEPDEADRIILQDTTHYRVMDIPGFWRADRSYYHNTIGGYHPAKLNRYEDLIQRVLTPVLSVGYHPELRNDSIRALYPSENQNMVNRLAAGYRALDMLNAKYIIPANGSQPVVANPYALGNAWFVDSIIFVDGADAEMNALMTLNPAKEAVADKRFEAVLQTETASLVPGDTIELVKFTPNRVTYRSESKTPAIGVFSEIWFPWGWKATIDGRPAELGRVNYVLRAMAIPAGQHEIVMTFDPDSLRISGGIAYASISLIYLMILLALFVEWRRIGR